jgi:hypothetical protein
MQHRHAQSALLQPAPSQRPQGTCCMMCCVAIESPAMQDTAFSGCFRSDGKAIVAGSQNGVVQVGHSQGWLWDPRLTGKKGVGRARQRAYV